ncbi:hypothetical protein NQZ68_020569 [Dissostichus eleginoides]|nr:hypothetical protein NQZ68_020569 [Dissostichus eleginoides]
MRFNKWHFSHPHPNVLINKSNLEVIRLEFAKLQKKLEECQKDHDVIKPYIGNCNRTGIMSIGKPMVVQLNAHLNAGYQYGGWGKDSKPHNTPFSMSKLNLTTAKYDYRVIPSASESFSYSYSPHQNMDFSADENGLWVMYATEASNGKIVIAKIDEKSFGIENEWSTAAYKQLAGNAFMACGVMYATRSVDLTTEEIFYAYDTRTNEEKHLSIHFSNDRYDESVAASDTPQASSSPTILLEAEAFTPPPSVSRPSLGKETTLLCAVTGAWLHLVLSTKTLQIIDSGQGLEDAARALCEMGPLSDITLSQSEALPQLPAPPCSSEEGVRLLEALAAARC